MATVNELTQARRILGIQLLPVLRGLLPASSDARPIPPGIADPRGIADAQGIADPDASLDPH